MGVDKTPKRTPRTPRQDTPSTPKTPPRTPQDAENPVKNPSNVDGNIGYFQEPRVPVPALFAEFRESGPRGLRVTRDQNLQTSAEANFASRSIVAYGERPVRNMLYEDSDEEEEQKLGRGGCFAYMVLLGRE